MLGEGERQWCYRAEVYSFKMLVDKDNGRQSEGGNARKPNVINKILIQG
jgi:hypothetical protein